MCRDRIDVRSMGCFDDAKCAKDVMGIANSFWCPEEARV